MEHHFVTRPLTNAHCEQIINVILPIQQIEFGVPITLDGQPDLLDIESNYINPGGGFWGTFDGDQLVGTIGLMNASNGLGVIRKMFVKKEYRGKDLGVAQQLLDILLQYCREHSLPHVCLGTVGQLKAAHRFYEKNGFQPLPAEDLPANFPRMKPDHIFYDIHLETTVPNAH
ncbi:MAG: GNAT family N-acetyltransferase [Citrobacter freundii]|nr:MAG: GNAT family N-acetyltransferase [Citrobacter freundii]